MWREGLSLCDLKTEQQFRCYQSDTFLIKLPHHVRAETIKLLDKSIDWYGQWAEARPCRVYLG